MYSKNCFLKLYQWIFIENQWSGFSFKITFSGNKLSITNHEVHGLSNSFQHIKNQKILQTDWPNAISPTAWESDFAGTKLSAES